MIKQLAHICIHSEDLSETLRFYQEGLGLEKAFEFVRDGEPFGFYLKLGGGTFLEVFAGESGMPGNIGHFALEVSSIDAVMERLRSTGFEVGEKKMGADHSWQAWLSDPSGVRIELHEYTPESLQLTGGICRINE